MTQAMAVQFQLIKISPINARGPRTRKGVHADNKPTDPVLPGMALSVRMPIRERARRGIISVMGLRTRPSYICNGRETR